MRKQEQLEDGLSKEISAWLRNALRKLYTLWAIYTVRGDSMVEYVCNQ